MFKKTKYYNYPHKYCPYCYEPMDTPTKYYCINEKCNRTTGDTQESFQVDYRGIPVCKCGNGAMKIYCTNRDCRSVPNIIPPAKTAIVVIAGMRSSGKSTFLLDIVNSRSSETGVIVSPKSYALIKWKEEGIKTIQAFHSLGNTESKKSNFSSVIGLQKSGHSKSSSEVILSLTDRPGEETQDLKKMLGLNYMQYADYIIILLDLLNIPGIKGELDEKGIKYSKEAEQIPNLTAVDNIITGIEALRGKYGKKVPVFVGISKWDYVEKADICPPGFSIGCYGPDVSSVMNSKGEFDKKKWKSNSNAIRNFLILHDEGELVNKLEAYFNTISFFAFSNYGTVPQITGSIATPPIHNPRHIMDPFYWIMKDINSL